MFKLPVAGDLSNESDVEQKLIWPLLMSEPLGLGYATANVRTKATILQKHIGKGPSSKIYRPDYIVFLSQFPVLIIEAKAPGADLLAALAEARMYAAVINAELPHDINPCSKVLATDGLLILGSSWDSEEVVLSLSLDDLELTNPKFAQLVEFAGATSLQLIANRLLGAVAAPARFNPISYVGGQSARNEELGYNTFGEQLAIDYRHLFNPRSLAERKHIVRNAYLPSKRRDQYADDIDRVIRAASRFAGIGGRKVDGDSPNELLAALRGRRSLENQVLLLVGGVGAGKSTFVDYLRDVKLPKDIKDSTVWIALDFDEAPPRGNVLEGWVVDQIIEGLKRIDDPLDLDDPATIEHVFWAELKRTKNILAGLPASSPERQRLWAEAMLNLFNDNIAIATGLARFRATERNKLLILVLDNCDKKDLELQLEVFQVAKWIQSWLRCLVFLPIRDVTYKNYKSRPPLDTASKGLIFKLEPPLFSKVLNKRLMLALEEMTARKRSTIREFMLPNGMRIQYPANEEGYYLTCVFRSLFDHDEVLRRIMGSMASGDLRKAMDIFVDFCRSGHITEEHFMQMRVSHGEYQLPLALVLRVLLRLHRRFYCDQESYVKNVFASSEADIRPDFFIRWSMLRWLAGRSRDFGPNGVQGFQRAGDMFAELIPLGHDLHRLRSEVRVLASAGCIVSERQQVTEIGDEDLIAITPGGRAHLRMVKDIEYLAACAEETSFDNEDVARRIAERVGQHGRRFHFTRTTMLENARELVEFLLEKDSETRSSLSTAVNIDDLGRAQMLNGLKATIDRRIGSRQGRQLAAFAQFTNGSVVHGRVTGIKDFGLFVELANGVTGLMHFSRLPHGTTVEDFQWGERIAVKVLKVDPSAKRIALAFVERLSLSS